MTAYDKLDWHLDGAVAAGQPPEHAFTHIGFYLAWLVRHDLHDPFFIPEDHVDAVKRGEMTGSDLADDIDTKLVSLVMTAEGAAFSDARYRAYLAAYGDLFEDLPEYGVPDDEPHYRRVDQLLDGLYAAWIADGRPEAPPEPPFEGDIPIAAVHVMVPPGYPDDELADLLSPWEGTQVTVMRAPTEAERPHVAPELEALIPRDLTSPAMERESVRASTWGSSLLKRALKRLGVPAKDAVVVSGLGGQGERTLSVSIYGIAGIGADVLDEEFRSVISRVPGSTWQRREVAGRTVNWASGREFQVAFWARDGLVIHVAGDPAIVEAAIGRIG